LFILLTFGILSKISSGQKYFETIGDFDGEYDTLEKQRKLIIKCSLLLENFNRLFWRDSDQWKINLSFSRMTKILAKTVSVVALFQVLLCYYTVAIYFLLQDVCTKYFVLGVVHKWSPMTSFKDDSIYLIIIWSNFQSDAEFLTNIMILIIFLAHWLMYCSLGELINGKVFHAKFTSFQ
jgi:hypothetical protein